MKRPLMNTKWCAIHNQYSHSCTECAAAAKRKPGFYWTMTAHKVPLIAQWFQDHWWLHGNPNYFPDNEEVIVLSDCLTPPKPKRRTGSEAGR